VAALVINNRPDEFTADIELAALNMSATAATTVRDVWAQRDIGAEWAMGAVQGGGPAVRQCRTVPSCCSRRRHERHGMASAVGTYGGVP
jgi:hypothetical protein